MIILPNIENPFIVIIEPKDLMNFVNTLNPRDRRFYMPLHIKYKAYTIYSIESYTDFKCIVIKDRTRDINLKYNTLKSLVEEIYIKIKKVDRFDAEELMYMYYKDMKINYPNIAHIDEIFGKFIHNDYYKYITGQISDKKYFFDYETTE